MIILFCAEEIFRCGEPNSFIFELISEVWNSVSLVIPLILRLLIEPIHYTRPFIYQGKIDLI